MLDLVGSVRLQTTNEIIRCTIRGLNEDYSEALIFSGDKRICSEGSIELMIFSPLENSPIKCNGRIVCDSNGNSHQEVYMGINGYLLNVYITHIGRLEQRRLGVLIAQKRAFFSSGR